MREIKFRLILDNKIAGYEKHGLAYHNGKKQIIAMHSSDNEEWWNTVHDPTKWIQHDDKIMDEWISVDDRLPNLGKCIIYNKMFGSGEAVYNSNGRWYDPMEEYEEFKDVTHWMYFPEDPE